jgi:hypothetical protein
MSHRKSKSPVPEIRFPGEPAARNGKRPPGSVVLSGPCPVCRGERGEWVMWCCGERWHVCPECGGTGRAGGKA